MKTFIMYASESSAPLGMYSATSVDMSRLLLDGEQVIHAELKDSISDLSNTHPELVSGAWVVVAN